jgi:hypothetical protein
MKNEHFLTFCNKIDENCDCGKRIINAAVFNRWILAQMFATAVDIENTFKNVYSRVFFI